MTDTFNVQLVGARGNMIEIMLPKRTMTKEEALVHAAWIVAVADESLGNEKFFSILREIQSS